MAAGIAQHLLAEMEVEDSSSADGSKKSKWSVESAGIACFGGGSAAAEAVNALKKQGIDISGHRSQPLTIELISRATVIYGMAQHHVDAVLDFVMDAAAKAHLLDPEGGDISDPIGMGQAVYEQTAAQLEKLIRIRIAEITKARTAKGRS